MGHFKPHKFRNRLFCRGFALNRPGIPSPLGDVRLARGANPTVVGFLYLLIVYGCVTMLILGGRSSEAMSLESLLPKKLPENWAVVEGPKIFNRKTLFEHIDGQADLFLKYGFEKSLFAGYQNSKRREDQIDLDLYDMGNVLQAFGVFSRHRNDHRPGGFGPDSYLDDESAFFYQGRYFVMFNSLEPNPSILKQMAIAISSSIVDPSPPPREIGFFPRQGLKPGSIQYFPEGLLGHPFLKRGFRGTYFDGEKEFLLFLARYKNAKESVSALKAHKDYLSQKGKVDLAFPAWSGHMALKGEDPYKGLILSVQKGSYLLGAVGFDAVERVENRLKELVRNLK